MKNIFRFLMAVAILFTASCTKEDISSSIGGGEVKVTFSASLPELGTRAYADGANAGILYYNVFDAATDEALPLISGFVTGSKVFTVNIPMLKGMTYDIVFWAQKEGSDYYALNGKELTVKFDANKKNANDNDRDAFYAYVDGFNPATAQNEDTQISLYRPFGQLNAATSDFEAVKNNGVKLTTSSLKVTTFSKLDLETGIATYPVEVTFDATAMPCTLEPNKETLKSGYEYLSMNYLLPGTVDAEYTFKGKRSDNSEVEFTGTTYTNVPVKANYRTNILGKLLTATTEFTVTIEKDFFEPDKDIVQTAAELQQQIENAPDGEETEIVLGGDIDLNDLLGSLGTLSTRAAATLPIVIPAEKSIILDLNGCRIDTPFEDENAGKHYYAFENRGTLTIKDTKGNGVINARGNFNYGTMTVESGTINAIDGNGGYGVRNYEGAAFIMNGGTIATTLEDDNQVDKGGYDATPLRVDEGATATINGGVVNNICDFTLAVDNYGDLTIKGGEFTSIHSTIGNDGTMTINGGSFTCNGLEGITAHALWAAAGTTTINGGTFNGKDNYNGFNVDAAEGATVYIKGGLFMPVHSGSLYGDGNIVVSGGKFFDKIKDSRLADGCTLVQEQEGDYWTINFTPAAKIGETTYNTLQDAIEAVQDGETIVLQRDLNITTPAYGQNALNYNKAVNCTIDLNGKTISANTGNSVLRFNITDSGATSDVELTIKNGTITAGENTWCALMATGIEGTKAVMKLSTVVVNNSKAGDFGVKSWANALINANNVTVNSTNCAGGFYAVGGEIVLDSCTVNQNGLHTAPYMSMAIAVSTNGKLTVNSGTYTTEPTAAAEGYNQGTSHGSWCGGVMNSGGKLIINGGTFANGNYGEDNLATHARGLIFGDTASEITINNGTFNALKNIIDYQNNLGVQPNPNIVINGGDFSANPSVVTSYGGVIIAEGKVPAQGANGRWTLVEDTSIKTAEALAAALAEGGEVVLGANITLTETPLAIPQGVTVVLDLNGKTLAHEDAVNNYALNNHGTLTIKGNGIVNARGIYNGYDTDGNYVATAKLIIENGTFNAKGTNGGAAVYNYGTVEIKGGKFESNGGYGLNNQTAGVLSVANAEVKGGIYNQGNVTIENSTVYQHLNGKHAIYNWTGSVTIQGGEFDSLSGNELILADGQDASVVINGGTFNKTAKSWLFGAATGKNISFVINGGTHNGYVNKPEMSVDTIRPYGDPIVVTGGTFNFNPTNWLAEGRAAIEKNGVWTVE